MLQQQSTVVRPVPLAEPSGVDADKCWQALRPHGRQGSPFCDVYEYIRRGTEVDLIDWNRFFVMQRGDTTLQSVVFEVVHAMPKHIPEDGLTAGNIGEYA